MHQDLSVWEFNARVDYAEKDSFLEVGNEGVVHLLIDVWNYINHLAGEDFAVETCAK